VFCVVCDAELVNFTTTDTSAMKITSCLNVFDSDFDNDEEEDELYFS